MSRVAHNLFDEVLERTDLSEEGKKVYRETFYYVFVAEVINAVEELSGEPDEVLEEAS